MFLRFSRLFLQLFHIALPILQYFHETLRDYFITRVTMRRLISATIRARCAYEEFSSRARASPASQPTMARTISIDR